MKYRRCKDIFPKTLLIFSPTICAPTDLPELFPPLGLAYIAAVLEERGFDVEIIDLLAEGSNNVKVLNNGLIRVGLDLEDVKNRIKSFNPDIVGISCPYTSSATEAHKVAKVVRETFPEAYIVFGGAHASSMPEVVLKDENIHAVVLGEGEMTFLNMVENMRKGEDIFKLNGVAFRKNKEVVRTPPREFIQDLDTLPFPAWHLLPMDIYLGDQRAHMYTIRSPRTSIITSRGCPFNCVFCSIHSIWGHKWRPRSPENVVSEIEFLVEKYKIKELAILDDNFTLDRKRVIRICNEIININLDIKWSTPNGVAIWTLDKKTLTVMKRSGYYRATFGIESGCKETLRFIRKPINLDHARKVINHCHELGLWVYSTFVIGFPRETLSSINQTIEFAKKSGLDFAAFYIATPYPGTDLCKIFKAEGLVKDDGLYDSVTKAGHNTQYFTALDLVDLVNRAHTSFLKYRIFSCLYPRNFIKMLNKLRSIEDTRYALKIGWNVLRMLSSALITSEVDYFSKTRVRSASK